MAQGRVNYTNNYDIIGYFVKGKKARCYNLDDIRVPQLVELEHRRRCENVPSVTNGQYGKTKFNQQGKNPGDVWGDIKQLIERLVLASSKPGDLVLDPFAGVGTCPFVCKQNGRNYIAFELQSDFVAAAKQRLDAIDRGQKTV